MLCLANITSSKKSWKKSCEKGGGSTVRCGFSPKASSFRLFSHSRPFAQQETRRREPYALYGPAEKLVFSITKITP